MYVLEAKVRAFLDAENIAYQRLDDSALLDRTVDALTAGQVVGWHQGRFEWGPRALGHRSILADPRRANMKDIVNTKIKFREPYRPFAPSVLAGRTGEYFAAPGVERQLSRAIHAAGHPGAGGQTRGDSGRDTLDGTGRLQVVVRDGNERYYDLIDRFGQATGVPVVLNTSFNLRGEPIVNTPEEAYSTFTRSGLDALVLGNCFVRKEG